MLLAIIKSNSTTKHASRLESFGAARRLCIQKFVCSPELPAGHLVSLFILEPLAVIIRNIPLSCAKTEKAEPVCFDGPAGDV